MRSRRYAFLAVLLCTSAASSVFAAARLTRLGDRPSGTFISRAFAASGDGSAVAGLSNPASGTEAFRWTSSGGMVGLGHLPGGGGSTAHGVSGDGSVIVGGSGSDSDRKAFRWTSAGGMVGLGNLPGGDFRRSTAHGVSADGSVIVGYGDRATGLGPEAVLWTSAGGMERLWDVLFANGVNPAADGWTRLAEAYGVSADGNAIVGYGIRNGNIEAFVAVVPEPSGLVLLILTVPALLLGRRWHRVQTAACLR